MISNKQFLDKELAIKVRDERCSSSVLNLAERHIGIFNKVYKSYSKPLSGVGYSYEAFRSDMNLIVFKACKSFKEDGGSKFSTWLCNHVRYFCLNEINNKNKKNRIKIDLKNFLEDDGGLVSDSQSQGEKVRGEAEYIMNLLSEMKDKRISKIFNMRYFGETDKNKLPWSKIGQELGISTQTAINLHEKGAKMVRNKINCSNNEDKI